MAVQGALADQVMRPFFIYSKLTIVSPNVSRCLDTNSSMMRR